MNPESREPCPDRILDDMGSAFGMGVIGGSAFHFLKGLKNSPSGSRFVGGAQAVRMNAPRIGGSFGVWGGLFSTFDCAMVYARQKEDPWNSIVAGAAAGGFLSIRQGLRAATKASLWGGALLGVIEGAGIMFHKFQSVEVDDHGYFEEEAGMSSTNGNTSWFGGLFGRKKDEVVEKSGVKTEILESFDSPLPPTYEFK